MDPAARSLQDAQAADALEAAGLEAPAKRELTDDERDALILERLTAASVKAKEALERGNPATATAEALVGLLDLLVAIVREDGLP